MDADKMHSLKGQLLCIASAILLGGPAWAATVLPLGKIEHEFVYDRLEREQALTFDYYNFQLGPYDANEGPFSYGPFDFLRTSSPTQLTLFAYANEDFTSVKSSSAEAFESIRGGVAANPHERIFIYGNVHLDERKAKDDSYTGKKWRGLAGGVEQAFGCYSTNRVRVTVGRFASFWGPRNSLLLSSTNPLDGFEYNLSWGRLVLSYRLAKLDGLNPDVDDVEQFENRFFAGHRLDIHLSRKVRLGFSETIIYGGPGRQIDLVYLNPIVFFHSDQLNEGIDDNTFLGFDFSYVPKRGVKLYGQVLIDDFQIDKETQSDQEPDQYGVIVGSHLVELAPSFDFRLEYNRVTNWTFNQMELRNRYLLEDDPIGAAKGNDYDCLTAEGTKWFNDELAVMLNLAYQRQGEGRVTADWTTPWFDIEGDYGEPFPTGVVEKTRSVSLRVKSFLFDHIYFDGEVGFDRVENYLHVEGDDRDLPFIRVRLSSFLSVPVSVE